MLENCASKWFINFPRVTQDGEILPPALSDRSPQVPAYHSLLHSAVWCRPLSVSVNPKSYVMIGFLCLRLSDGQME